MVSLEQRIEGDYASNVLIVAQDAQELIVHAKEFLKSAELFWDT